MRLNKGGGDVWEYENVKLFEDNHLFLNTKNEVGNFSIESKLIFNQDAFSLEKMPRPIAPPFLKFWSAPI